MAGPSASAVSLGVALACWLPGGAAAVAGAESGPFPLGPPAVERGPVEIRAGFAFQDIDEINDQEETFAFSGVLVLEWRDPRQAFDPAIAGVDEKVYQGDYQFNELATGWYPQVVLLNESGLYESSGVLLRVASDGTSTLVEMVHAVAEVELDMRRLPFDRHRLEATFGVLGFDSDEVVLLAKPGLAATADGVRVPQWTITSYDLSIREHPSSYSGERKIASSFVAGVNVRRNSFYFSRLVVIPLFVIVLLSFSVFWMDRSSLGDRLAVSFIGILTGVAYQLVVSDHMPRISYFTLMNGFLNLSFFTMCATVLINLRVGALDKRGSVHAGDLLDRRCRWAFPAVYSGLIAVMLLVAFVFF